MIDSLLWGTGLVAWIVFVSTAVCAIVLYLFVAVGFVAGALRTRKYQHRQVEWFANSHLEADSIEDQLRSKSPQFTRKDPWLGSVMSGFEYAFDAIRKRNGINSTTWHQFTDTEGFHDVPLVCWHPVRTRPRMY